MDAENGNDAEVYAALSLLLRYPEAEWVQALPEIRRALPSARREALAPLLAWLAHGAVRDVRGLKR